MTRSSGTGPGGPATAARPRAVRLDPAVRRIFVGVACSAVGNGLTLPFLYVYLAEVRGLATLTVGLLFAWSGVVGVAVSAVAGTLVDRLGPRHVVVGALVVEAVGTGLLALVTGPGSALLVTAVVAAGGGALWPATTSLLTRLVPESGRERVYGLQFVLLNAGIGVGGLLSALLVDVDHPASFQRLYVLDALTYLAYVAMVATLPPGTGDLPEPAAADAGEEPTVVLPRGLGGSAPTPSGWSAVRQDRVLVRFALTALLLVTAGYAQLEAGFTAYAVEVADVPPRALGVAFAVNTAAIVAGQLVVLRWARGRRRSRLLALAAGVWAVAWAVVALAAVVPGGLAVLCVVTGLAVFGIGETLWAPMAPAVVNALAPEELRGRYNAVFSGTWTFAMIVGPALAGLLVGSGLAWLWVLLTVGGCALGARLMLRLRVVLTPEQDGLLDLPHDRAREGAGGVSPGGGG